METLADVTRMRLVGGALTLDFLNTRSGPPEGPPDDDVLADYGALIAWCRYTRILGAADAGRLERASRKDPQAATAALQHSLRTRDNLHHVIDAIRSGGVPDSRALSLLRDDEADALRHGQLEKNRNLAWSWTNDRSLDRPLRQVIHSAVELLTTGPLDRIKRCAGCSYFFLDESKNRSRRWCSMEDCGAREKSRRYVSARRRRGATVDDGTGVVSQPRLEKPGSSPAAERY